MDGLKESQELLAAFDDVSMAMGEPDADLDALLAQQATLQDKIEHLNCWDLSREVEKAMAALKVPARETDVNVLSGGELQRVALCRLLLEKPDMLLLDELTNRLDAESVHWLEEFLQKYRGTVLSITRDRYGLENVAGWVLELDRDETERAMLSVQNKLHLKLPGHKHQGSKKANKARVKKLQDMESSGFRTSARIDEGQIVVPSGSRLGNKVIKVNNLRETLDDGRVLFDKLSFEIPLHAIVGTINGNGM
ncbi:unnamed protein product [Hyaloperonospora brassicae]|uniref:ABC transporter domain-containing protein n=1 Tax=Hyaloperonospora brassicae TaxID=162125 RepID=A0AAV0T4N1_HYABA|nr:unnamed protein product [Hyaloperonospora brassicae]